MDGYKWLGSGLFLDSKNDAKPRSRRKFIKSALAGGAVVAASSSLWKAYPSHAYHDAGGAHSEKSRDRLAEIIRKYGAELGNTGCLS
ncbi:MAG: twin-arginine translocation signal domain-containing protein [Acidobacteriota bacterium]